MGSWNLGRGLLADLSYASEMSVRETCFRCLHSVYHPTTVKLLLQMEMENHLYSQTFRVGETKPNAEPKYKESDHEEKAYCQFSSIRDLLSVPSCYNCGVCGCVCRSQIGLNSHQRNCLQMRCIKAFVLK